ncbi:hypothetical protein [Streptomyces sp. NBC_00568]|uniref:hypothetical protein n=1 Tax=Streptomyces sp. NBC_00568 TaxID=2975779 RepID=UPI00225B9E99|nr:hypothetical protein [Streptomyces sp. NBC_00568]MCX4993573.1 hypothetical protein [Streptomyces sp. NBC_00568]
MSATDFDKVIPPHRWLERRARPRLRTLAGHTLRMDAAEFLGVADADPVRWRIGRRVWNGRLLDWTPRQPGRYRITATTGSGRSRSAWCDVGLRASDLVERADALSYYFCLVVRRDFTLHFIPLLAKDHESDATHTLSKEAEGGHRAFRALMASQAQVYGQQVLRRIPALWHRTKRVQDGIYAVWPSGLTYLGSAPDIAAAGTVLADALGQMKDSAQGRARLLRSAEDALDGLSPDRYAYSDEPAFPSGGVGAIERFAMAVVNPLTAGLLAFSKDVGLSRARGIITFSASTGMLSTRLFDTRIGLWRQLSTGFDFPGRADARADGMPADRFGRGSSRAGALGGLLNTQGTGSFTGSRQQWAMDGYSEEGTTWEPGTYGGSPGEFGYRETNGNPDGYPDKPDYFWPDSNSGGETPTNEVDFDAAVIFGNTGTDPDDGTDGGGDDPDAGTDTGGGDDPDAGTDSGGGDDPDAGSDPDGGDDPVVDPEAGTPAPDDSGGHGGGSLGSAAPVIVTRGGGYTDPGEGQGNTGGGRTTITPGGGYTDPDRDGVPDGMAIWGGYNAPIGHEVDPVFDPPPGAFRSAGAVSLSKTVTVHAGVRIEEYAGMTPGGIVADGVFSTGTSERMPGSRGPRP